MTITTEPTRTATWTVTTRQEPWRRQPDLDLEPLSFSSMADLPSAMVKTEDRRQTIEGFGACFNELGWLALSHLSQHDRDTVLDALFLPAGGLELTLCRIPIGANDFSTDWYSHDETVDDFELRHFSVEHDERTLLPFIGAALHRRPGLRLWASPWSPPTWMKTNGHYAGALPWPGSDVLNGLTAEQVRSEGTDMFRLEPRYLQAYARYFARFIEAYRAQGIDIEMVMPQNEFNSPQVFPSCTWTPDGLARFITVLGPEMDRLGVRVFLGTLERSDPDLVAAVLEDPAAASWISGVGLQWGGRRATAAVRRAAPGLQIYQTEQECGDGRNDWRFARHTWSILKQFFFDGASGYMYWNIALETGGVSRWGWAQNSLVVVDPTSGTYEFTHEFYFLRHVSAFVHPGADRIEAFSWTGFENQIVFQNPDGEVVVVVQNDTAEEMQYSIAVDGQLVRVALPADSLSTLVLPPSADQRSP